jgi:hypothetical protein
MSFRLGCHRFPVRKMRTLQLSSFLERNCAFATNEQLPALSFRGDHNSPKSYPPWAASFDCAGGIYTVAETSPKLIANLMQIKVQNLMPSI